jgi:minor pilin subunit PapK
MEKRSLFSALTFMQVTILGGSLLYQGNVSASEMNFTGELIDRPCRVAPSSLFSNVEFFDIAALTFNNPPGKGYEESFKINLEDCHPDTIGKVVTLTFTGSEELQLPGYLETIGANPGRLAIGIIDTDGKTLLPLGEPHNGGAGDVVTGSTLTLPFKAFVQSTPDALAQKAVVPGPYYAVATFELEYK